VRSPSRRAWEADLPPSEIGPYDGIKRKEDGVAMRRSASAGVTEHGNSAVLVTVGPGGELFDRRRIDLTGPELPTHPITTKARGRSAAT
jgi:hypothetical protein